MKRIPMSLTRMTSAVLIGLLLSGGAWSAEPAQGIRPANRIRLRRSRWVDDGWARDGGWENEGQSLCSRGAEGFSRGGAWGARSGRAGRRLAEETGPVEKGKCAAPDRKSRRASQLRPKPPILETRPLGERRNHRRKRGESTYPGGFLRCRSPRRAIIISTQSRSPMKNQTSYSASRRSPRPGTSRKSS